MNWKLTADILVIAAYFAAIVGIGLYFSRRTGDMHDFALGGRSIPWWTSSPRCSTIWNRAVCSKTR